MSRRQPGSRAGGDHGVVVSFHHLVRAHLTTMTLGAALWCASLACSPGGVVSGVAGRGVDGSAASSSGGAAGSATPSASGGAAGSQASGGAASGGADVGGAGVGGAAAAGASSGGAGVSPEPGTGGNNALGCGRPIPASPVDLTPQIIANAGNNDIVLNGKDFVITLPATAPAPPPGDVDNLANVPNVPTTYYHGVISGTGTITVKAAAGGAARLVLTNRSTYAVPLAQQVQFSVRHGFGPTSFDGVTFPNGTSSIYVSHHVNPPALYIEPRATVQFGSKKRLVPGGGPAEFFNKASSRPSDAAAPANFANIQNNGLLVVNSVGDTGPSSTWIHLGAVSGCGDLTVTESTGSMAFSGTSTYTGKSIFYATNVGETGTYGAIPNTSVIFNIFVLVYNTPIRSYYSTDAGPPIQNVTPAIEADPNYFGTPGVLKISQKIYGSHHGNSIHNIGRGGVDVFTGSYSYSDSGDQRNPSLSDPTLDFTSFNGNASHRIFYLHGGSITQFGDGTTADLFAKGNEVTVTLALQGSATLALFYSGVVRFNIPINAATNPNFEGGHFFIMGAAGRPANHVILTQPAYYKGATHIDSNAILQLGDGTPGNSRAVKVKASITSAATVDGVYSTSRGNGSILTPGNGDGTGSNSIVGTATNLVINNGQLIVNNVLGALDGIAQTTLSHISGTGSVTQLGSAPLTLLGNNSYAGGTTVGAGTLLVGADSSLGAGALVNQGTLTTTATQHTVNVAGAFTQGASGTLRLNAAGAGTAAAIDTVKVAGRATLAGTLVINAAPGFAPAVGQKFVVVQAPGGLGGTFSAVTGSGVRFLAGYDATTAFVTVSP